MAYGDMHFVRGYARPRDYEGFAGMDACDLPDPLAPIVSGGGGVAAPGSGPCVSCGSASSGRGFLFGVLAGLVLAKILR